MRYIASLHIILQTHGLRNPYKVVSSVKSASPHAHVEYRGEDRGRKCQHFPRLQIDKSNQYSFAEKDETEIENIQQVEEQKKFHQQPLDVK